MRNEAWVLEAFLTCASSWADFIILADQHSDDGSREIATRFEKVILVDNDANEMNQAAARLLLFKKVDEIPGDKIVLALDADEFLSEGFEKTDGWKRIVNSKPNELFCFRWQNLYGDYCHETDNTGFMEWGCHFGSFVSIADEYYRCEQRAVHEMRVPCRPSFKVSCIEIQDIKFVHLARVNLIRQRNKEDFYQVSSVSKLKKRISAVSAFRQYHHTNPRTITLEKEARLYVKGTEIDARNLVKMEDYGQYYIDEMKAIFKRDGVQRYLKLDLWDNPFLKEAGVNPRIPLGYRLLHSYLRKTQSMAGRGVIGLLDKVLKRIV